MLTTCLTTIIITTAAGVPLSWSSIQIPGSSRSSVDVSSSCMPVRSGARALFPSRSLKPSCSFLIDGTEPQDLQAALPVFLESFNTPTEDNGYSLGSLESNLSELKTELDSLSTTQLVLSLLLSHIDVLSNNTSQDPAEFTTWMNSKIMELKTEELTPTLVSMCPGLQEAVDAAIPEVRHTKIKWKLLCAIDIIFLSAATAISTSLLPASYWILHRFLMTTSHEEYPHPRLPQVLDNISLLGTLFASSNHSNLLLSAEPTYQ